MNIIQKELISAKKLLKLVKESLKDLEDNLVRIETYSSEEHGIKDISKFENLRPNLYKLQTIESESIESEIDELFNIMDKLSDV